MELRIKVGELKVTTKDNTTGQQENEYRTTDIYLSAYLIAGRHAGLVRVEPSGDRRKTFVLSPCPNLDIIQAFYSGNESSRVVAREVMEELRNLKGMILNDAASGKGGGVDA